MAASPHEPCSPRPVLLLAFYFAPENITGAARPYRFYRYLEPYGYQPHVITSSPQPGGAPPRVRFVAGVRTPDKRSLMGLSEYLLWRSLMSGHEGTTWTPLAVREARQVPLRDMAAVISTSPPLCAHLAALWLKRRYGVKWIADFRDPLVGNPFSVKKSRYRRVDAAIERRIFERADLLIANTDAVQRAWCARYPQHAHKTRVLWNGFDPAERIAAAPLPPGGRRTLVHVGQIYGKRHPAMLLASLVRLLNNGRMDPGALRVRLVGTVDRPRLEVNLDAFGVLERAGVVEYGAPVPRDEATRLIEEAHLLLLLDVQGAGAGVQVPAKTFDIIRVGRPVLASTSRNSPLERILERSSVPHTCLYFGDSEAEVDAKVIEFLSLPSTPVRASDWFWQTFDGAAQAKTLAEWLDSLEDSGPATRCG